METYCKVYAIRVGDFIELRASTFTPKAKVSKLTRTKMVADRRMYWDEISQSYKFKTEPSQVKTVFQQIHYIGGRVLGYTSPSKCRTLFGKYPSKDKMQELTKAHTLLALNAKWRAKHL